MTRTETEQRKEAIKKAFNVLILFFSREDASKDDIAHAYRLKSTLIGTKNIQNNTVLGEIKRCVHYINDLTINNSSNTTVKYYMRVLSALMSFATTIAPGDKKTVYICTVSSALITIMTTKVKG